MSLVGFAALFLTVGGLFIEWLHSRPPGYLQAGFTRVRERKLFVGERLEFNLSLINPGGKPVDGVFAYTDVVFFKPDFPGEQVTRSVQTQLRAMALKHMQDATNAGSSGVRVDKGEVLWETHAVPNLGTPGFTSEQVRDIRAGTLVIVVYTWARWRDEPKDYEQCGALQAPTSDVVNTGNAVWRLCEGD